MHRAPASTSIDFLYPPQHSHFSSHLSTNSQPAWARTDLNIQTPTYVNSSERKKDSSYISQASSVPLQSVPSYLEAPTRDGLRTPPSDDMATAYQTQQYNNYGTRQDTAYSVAPPSYSNSAAATNPYLPATFVARTTADGTAGAVQPYVRPQSPRDVARPTTEEDAGRRKSVILPSLQIPSSINNSGGSLGEFAAQITCLFWFESTSTLRKAEELTQSSSPVQRLVPDAIPTMAFRKWVVTILSTTQVTPNVILLALLFVYRLKTLNPTVKGRAGSEYRLLTVALMLGNKFLDDNTYTNKTWAEVSGISVGEIHVMEVEFLGNMRYSLLASKEQWEEWQRKLRKFAEYFDKASRVPAALPSPVAAIGPPPVLPSPPTSMQASPPSLATYAQTPYSYNQQWSSQYQPSPNSSLPSMPELVPSLALSSGNRKRSYDEGAEEPPAKRLVRPNDQVANCSMAPMPRNTLPRLPVPNLTISTTQAINAGLPAYAQNAPLLPPLSGRAMSTVYPTTPGWSTQTHGSVTPTGPMSGSSGQHVIHGTHYGTPSRRHSPRSVQDLLSLHSSPTSGSFPAHVHAQNSPSFFLQQRSSPYRPIRLPNTLLHPPPSASMHGFAPMNIEQMHYQPLGKRNDYRSGIVPDYSHGQYPVMRQPNFYN